MIRIDKLKKSYDGKTVVDIERLEIPAGKIFGIIGGNGSGKTTLLKMIGELIEKDQGHIKRNIALHEMVYLFQKPHLFNTSVYNNIAYPLKFRKVHKASIDKQVREIAVRFDITHLLAQNALELSGGEAQKVNLARALVFKPKLVLLDEPTANIDAKSTRQIEMILKSLKISIVLVTHNLLQAERLCEEVAIIQEGKILTVGPAESSLKHPSLTYI